MSNASESTETGLRHEQEPKPFRPYVQEEAVLVPGENGAPAAARVATQYVIGAVSSSEAMSLGQYVAEHSSANSAESDETSHQIDFETEVGEKWEGSARPVHVRPLTKEEQELFLTGLNSLLE